MLARAHVWHPTEVTTADLRQAGGKKNSIHDNETICCTYVDMRSNPLHGSTPKFECKVPNSDKALRIKYGKTNGEVYGAIASSRILHALGFYTDEFVPVIVKCSGCSDNPWVDKVPQPNKVATFNYALTAKKLKGTEIVKSGNDRSGVAWAELELIQSDAGGSPKAEVEALKLMAAVLQNGDMKPDNQTLTCKDKEFKETHTCNEPIVYMHDIGSTFSTARPVVGFKKFDLSRYTKTSVWENRAECRINLKYGSAVQVAHPNRQISEAGRQFLAKLLVQLTHAQIVDAFRESNVENFNPKYTPEAWAIAFEQKIAEVTNGPSCPTL